MILDDFAVDQKRDTSQYGEGRWIIDHFAGRVGRFLDVGAYNGKLLSNTWPLAQLGWSGVCVEPSPLPFAGLMATYEDNDRVMLVNAALTFGPARLMPFHSTGDALSSTERKHRDKFAGYPFTEILIPGGIGWDELLAEVDHDGCAGHFNFVNLDVEGKNAAVLSAMPIRPEMICVEYDPDADGVNTVHDILTSWGYRITVIGGNVLGVRG